MGYVLLVTSEAWQALLVEIECEMGSTEARLPAEMHSFPAPAQERVDEMRAWLDNGEASYNLPAVVRVRDYLGIPVGDEYEALLVRELGLDLSVARFGHPRQEPSV